MNTEFTLSYETVDNIIKGVLLELYEELKDTQEKKKAMFGHLEDYEGDYISSIDPDGDSYDETLLEATKILVCYYTIPVERPEELSNL